MDLSTLPDLLDKAITLGTFASVWAVLAVGHNLADHVIGQTDHQADHKAAPSEAEVAEGANPRRGWGACLAHVTQYHLVMGAMVALVWAVLPLRISWPGLAAGLAVSIVTHAFLDRRWPVRWLLEHIGSKGFADLKAAGMNGMYLTDQALHQTALLVSALLIARL
ncbi:DUF3307 domain-containing protein [Kitasatospora sp. NPDC004723]|uniref:DUF3307 domain-containing protein n=1 Tax=Kitasatospora sp. NPDC004723 TaxID=3154288 RepID=UPI00339E756D